MKIGKYIGISVMYNFISDQDLGIIKGAVRIILYAYIIRIKDNLQTRYTTQFNYDMRNTVKDLND